MNLTATLGGRYYYPNLYVGELGHKGRLEAADITQLECFRAGLLTQVLRALFCSL